MCKLILTDTYYVHMLLNTNYFFQEKKVKKIYLALAASPLPIGIIKHYMRPTNTAPRLISEGNYTNWNALQRLLDSLEMK